MCERRKFRLTNAEDVGLPPFATDPPDWTRIANDAHVDHVLVGTIMRAGSAIRVSTQLLTTPDGTVAWSNTWQGSLNDVFQLQDDIVNHIVESLSLQLRPRDQRARHRDVPASASAYELYLRGNQILVQGLRGGQDLGVARDLYRRCLEEDPNFAPAWARLGRCYWLLSKGSDEPQLVSRAQECFERALTLNPDLALAHNLYAQVEPDLNRATEATLRLIGRIREGRAEPELYVALTHACRFCGFLEASVESHERARRLDPDIQTSVNQTYYQLGDFASAQKTMGKGTVFLDALMLFEQGHREKALSLLRERERSNLLPVTRDYLDALRAWIEGKREESIALCRRVAKQLPDGEGLMYIARMLAALGEGGEAATLLHQCLEKGFNPYRVLQSEDGALKSVRDHSSYPELLTAAQSKYLGARQAFIDAGGETLLGVTIPSGGQ